MQSEDCKKDATVSINEYRGKILFNMIYVKEYKRYSHDLIRVKEEKTND